MSDNIQNHSVEEGFEKLEEIITKMEAKDVSLEDSFALYKSGMEELAYCQAKIDKTAKAVMALQADGELITFEEV